MSHEQLMSDRISLSLATKFTAQEIISISQRDYKLNPKAKVLL